MAYVPGAHAYQPGVQAQPYAQGVQAQPYTPGMQQVVIGKPAGRPQPPPVWQAAHAQQQAAGASSSATWQPQPVPGEADEVFACKDPRLPPEVRLAFVKKVYGILFSMLLVTFGICVPFVFFTGRTMAFMGAHQWIIAVVGAILLMQYMLNMCMLCGAMCGSFGMMEGYMRMMKTVPWNYLYLFVFSGCFGVVVGFICAQYTVQSVLLVFGISAVLILALTVYAVRTKADFTGCGAYIMVMIMGLLMLLLVGIFFRRFTIWHKVIGAAGAMLFGFLIVYDTQQIFGSASSAFGGGSRQLEYSVDMYAFAAWNLYLDFINFFIYLLQLFGGRRD